MPRYIDPSQNIDNSLADNMNMYNADFIYTLDYFTFRRGLIGLHGYTHQNGNENILNRLEHIPSGTLASFYFHPFIEFDSISIMKDEDSVESYDYSPNSPLHKVIQGFHKNKYRFEKITELKRPNDNVHYASFK